jgi:hypothetical protein
MVARRRPRNSVNNPTPLGYTVDGDVKREFDALALKAGISASGFIELAMRRALTHDLNDQGVPSWLPEQTNQELPINPS